MNVKDGSYGNIFSGYFKAPATGRYRFYMSCDDTCSLSLGNEAMNPLSLAVILQLDRYSGYRNYFTVSGSRISSWITLTKDNYYPIEAKHVQITGADHFTVSVEIEDASAPNGHFHSMREIQRLSINLDIVRE